MRTADERFDKRMPLTRRLHVLILSRQLTNRGSRSIYPSADRIKTRPLLCWIQEGG